MSTADVDEVRAAWRGVLAQTRGLDRRDFVRALTGLATTAAGSTVVFATLANIGRSQAEQPVTYFGYGGAWKAAITQAFFDPFTRKTGIPVQYQEPYIFAKLRAMHEAKAQQIDLVGLTGMEVYIAARTGMMTPIDWSVVDKSALDPRQLHLAGAIGCTSQSMNVCYSKKKWPGADHPSSWADFWDVEKFPGRRALRRDAVWTMEAAAKADGVKDEAFYPLEVERVFRSLDRIKPHIKTWWSDNSQAQQLMEQEEVDLIHMTNGLPSPFWIITRRLRSSGTRRPMPAMPKAGSSQQDAPTRRAACRRSTSWAVPNTRRCSRAFFIMPRRTPRRLRYWTNGSRG
jgi:putative spermidine/putrescine transport system substrate-binding protein